MIKKACEVKKDFMGYVAKLYRRACKCEFDYDMSYYRYENILEHPEKANKLYVVLNGRQIVDIISYDMIHGLLFLYPFFTEKYSLQYTKKAILEHFSGQKYIVSTSWSLGKGFKECNRTTTYDEKSYYHFEGCNVQYVPEDGDENMLRDTFEATRFPEYDENAITFKTIAGNDVNKYLYKKEWSEYPMATNENNMCHIAGFHYFQPDFEPHHSLFVAELAGVPIAVIKTGVYGKDYYQHVGLNYIDVCVKYRQKGLATRIIKEFSKLQQPYPFVLSDESEMGKKCNMQAHFKQYMPNAFNSKEWENKCIEVLESRNK